MLKETTRRWHRRGSDGAFSALAGVFLGVLLVGCAQEARNPVKAKVFALNPREYVGTSVELSGKVTSVGPADSYFVVEDDTGKVLVTTERIGDRVACRKGSNVVLTGKLAQVADRGMYFSMESLLACRP